MSRADYLVEWETEYFLPHPKSCGGHVFSSRPIREIRPRGKKERGRRGEILSEFLATFNKFSLSAPRKTFLRLILNTGNFKLGGKYRRGVVSKQPSSRYIAIRTETETRKMLPFTIEV